MTTITREQLRERAREKVKSLEFAVTQTAFSENRAELEEELELARIALASLEAAEKRIAELEAKLDSADKLQDSAFRHGLQHGFSLGQTDNQAGFEECLSAYGTGKGE
ncbi:TPA: hypothetical protein ACM3YW_003908 [Escherichia coli]